MEYNVINLESYCYEMVKHDKINITLAVEVKEKTKQETTKALNVKVQELKELFLRNGLTAHSDLQGVHEEFEHIGNKYRKTTYFIGYANLNIISYDFNLINQIIGQVIESNVAQIKQIVTSVSEKTKKDKEEALTVQAIEMFKVKASTVTRTFEFSNYKVVNISINLCDENPNMYNNLLNSAVSSQSIGSVSDKDSNQHVSPRDSKVYVTIKGSVQLH